MSITFNADTDQGECHADWIEGVNLANGNAFMVLRAMGIEPDYMGVHEASDFYNRALLLTARDMTPADEAQRTDPFTDRLVKGLAGGGAEIVTTDLPPDYLVRVGERFMEVAERAEAEVVWA